MITTPQTSDLDHFLEDIPFGPEGRDADGFYRMKIAMPGKHGKSGKKGGKKGGGKKGGGRKGY